MSLVVASAVDTQPAGGPALDAQAVEERLGWGRADRRLVQQGLEAAGFDSGGADGLFGLRPRGKADGSIPTTADSRLVTT